MGWKTNEALNEAIEMCYENITNHPEYLLETDGGPIGEKSDIYASRLYGLDDELVQQMFIPEVRSEWLMPAQCPPSFRAYDDVPMGLSLLRHVEFKLQSNYGTVHLDVMHLPKGAPYDSSTFRAKILCLRYKRRNL